MLLLMPLVDLAQLAPGMVLSADVLDRRGQRLLGAGTELSDRHLRALKMWGVGAVRIRGDRESRPAGAEIPSSQQLERLRAAEQVASRLSAHNDLSHPLIRLLYRRSMQALGHGTRRAQ